MSSFLAKIAILDLSSSGYLHRRKYILWLDQTECRHREMTAYVTCVGQKLIAVRAFVVNNNGTRLG